MKTIASQEFLKMFPNFKLVNRDTDLERISSILCRKKNNSLLITGPRGVGVTSLLIGLQQLKEKDDTSFDILSKQFFVLDVDDLFSSGDSEQINKEFQQVINNLEKTPNSVLVILDAYNFLEGAKNSGNLHFINTLNNADRSNLFQVIMEVNDDQLNSVYTTNYRINDFYTLYDVKELSGQKLEDVVKEACKELIEYHGIGIDEETIKEAIRLTTKYREDYGLGITQPARTIALLDRALAAYKQSVNKQHPALTNLMNQILSSTNEEEKKHLQEIYNASYEDWMNTKLEIQKLAKEQSEGEVLRLKYTEELEKAKEKQEKGEVECDAISKRDVANFKALMKMGFDSKEVCELKQQLKQINDQLRDNKRKYQELIKNINNGLALDKSHLMDSFSKISGISSAKLDENEIESLVNLESNLLKDIYGQDSIVKRVADAIKVAKLDKNKDNGPAASFLFLGPSGCGKTFLSKSLAKNLFGDEKTLIRFDMSEYMEKHAVAKLIGAPPGYEGFECGGILTNTVRKNPMGVYLFDEIEKAHPDVFNIFLQILSDGRLTDNIGRTVDFSEAIIVMTSNIGQKYYLDTSLTDEESQEKANEELCKTYRSELLNRFNGRENIFHFKRLSMETIQKIVRREINNLSKAYEEDMCIQMSDREIEEFCKDQYDPIKGARGLPGFIKAHLRPKLVDEMLHNNSERPAFWIRYDKETKDFYFDYIVTVDDVCGEIA